VGKQYYYLIAGLKDLIIDPDNKLVDIDEFIEFCGEQLDEKDFISLKKLFIFNDIKNAAKIGVDRSVYLTPSFYSREDFTEHQKDTDRLLPFLAEYFYHRNNDEQENPELNEVDELVHLFYDHLEDEEDRFVKSYFEFELNLRNISNAISMRVKGNFDKNRLINRGDYIESMVRSNTLDMGLTDEFPYITKLIEAYHSNDMIKIEKTIDEIRWDFLDSSVGLDHFGAVVVFGYMIKLVSVDRWLNITTDKGKSVLDGLISKIRASVKFSEDFITVGGKK